MQIALQFHLRVARLGAACVHKVAVCLALAVLGPIFAKDGRDDGVVAQLESLAHQHMMQLQLRGELCQIDAAHFRIRLVENQKVRVATADEADLQAIIHVGTALFAKESLDLRIPVERSPAAGFDAPA